MKFCVSKIFCLVLQWDAEGTRDHELTDLRQYLHPSSVRGDGATLLPFSSLEKIKRHVFLLASMSVYDGNARPNAAGTTKVLPYRCYEERPYHKGVEPGILSNVRAPTPARCSFECATGTGVGAF